MCQGLIVTVVPNWNLKQETSECIESLLNINYTCHKIVIVDNGSNDGSVQRIRDHYPMVYLIELDTNVGYAAALNEGIRYAINQGAEYVFALNNDTIVKPDVLNKLINWMVIKPQLGVITPKVVYFVDPKRIFSLGAKRFRYLPIPVEFGHKWVDRPKYDRYFEFDYVTGCAMLIRTSLFNKVGLFDTSYFMYYEDNDFCHRVRDQGYQIACDGSSLVFHKASISSKGRREQTVFLRIRNKIWYYRRYPHSKLPFLTLMFVALSSLVQMGKYLLNNEKSLLRAYIGGFQSGFRDALPKPDGTKL